MRLLFHSHPSLALNHLDLPITNHIQDHYLESIMVFLASTILVMNTIQVKDLHAYIGSCSPQLQLQEDSQTPSKIISIVCNNISFYTHYRIHIFCWLVLTHDCLLEERSYMGTLPYRQRVGILSLCFNFLCQHSHLKINSFAKEDTQHTQRFLASQQTVHVCLHK